MIKILSWNVNGLRSCASKGFLSWFKKQAADIVCLQEIKVKPEQLPPDLLNPNKYNSFWYPAQKPGYSGVAIISKQEPESVKLGLGVDEFDCEGRVITAEFKDLIVINSYFPNSQRDHSRLPFKLRFCTEFARHAASQRRRGKTLLMCADWNIAPSEIDLKNPKSNRKNAGFLPEERAWMKNFLDSGYIDAFRYFTKDPEHYTWWSYRPGIREKNIGWRLDYFLSANSDVDRLISSNHQTRVYGSDHCPVSLTVKS